MLRTALTTLLAAAAVAAPAAADDTIRPGDYHRAIDDGWCTLNFVYDGIGDDAGRVFVGSAAHCVLAAGAEVTLGTGAAASDMADLTRGEVLGHVVALDPVTDWALVEVRPELEGRVEGGLRGHPDWPVGAVDPAMTREGDTIAHEGWGTAFSQDAMTRESREGVLRELVDGEWRALSPIMGGDSGGPVVHVATGTAIGSLRGYSCATTPPPDCRMSGPLVATALAGAAQQGFDLALRPAHGRPPVVTAPAPGPASSPSSSSPPPAPAGSPAPASSPAPAAKPASRSRLAACRAKARRIKSAKKRRAALKRCAKRRGR